MVLEITHHIVLHLAHKALHSIRIAHISNHISNIVKVNQHIASNFQVQELCIISFRLVLSNFGSVHAIGLF